LHTVTVIIVTANRADELSRTLASLGAVRPVGACELVVVDNNSSDRTQEVVERNRPAFAYPVRYEFNPVPGKYGALNEAIARTAADIIVATDDDARFEADWLEQAVAGLEAYGCDFVGGPVRPLWGAARPRWLPAGNGLHDKVIAVLDHGPEPREFGHGISWPLGVNVAYRRSAFARAGLFEPSLGRIVGTLRNQAQREWHLRARNVGIWGMYVPGMVVHHVIPSERLTKQYFRRWLYWHGISRAILCRHRGTDIENPESPVTGRRGAEIAGIPWRLVLTAVRSVPSWVWRSLRGDSVAAFERELWLCFFAGVVRQRWTDRHRRSQEVSASALQHL
jgi:glucosyl-dolichyl phosphate glucuronosyltransferase